VMPGIRYADTVAMGEGLHAEHGHAQTLYNRPDWRNDPAHGRPMGYFIARLVRSAPGDARSFRDFAAYLDDLLEALITGTTLSSSIIEALAERAGVDAVVLPDGSRVTIEELQERYAHAGGSPGAIELARRIREETHLGGTADRLARDDGHRVVLLGHTHSAELDKDTWFVDDRIYGNCGSWCDESAHGIELEARDDGGVVVRLDDYDALGGLSDSREQSL